MKVGVVKGVILPEKGTGKQTSIVAEWILGSDNMIQEVKYVTFLVIKIWEDRLLVTQYQIRLRFFTKIQNTWVDIRKNFNNKQITPRYIGPSGRNLIFMIHLMGQCHSRVGMCLTLLVIVSTKIKE